MKNGPAQSASDEQSDDKQTAELSYDELVSRVSPIANPMASRKLTKKLYKVIKKASKVKMVRRGVKEVQKFLRKGEKGFVVFAGDVTPIEVMCHLPAVCEDLDLPYAYVPSKSDLGAASGAKRATCCILVKSHADYTDSYKECLSLVKALPPPI
ncbi:H/ACA ribonucleoprotein complex subunit 2-like protein [Diadema antillarum]|uniref:H/ACA ribonucleoprotein complex subunit 2-like protein n=1 Tax=Diadema antillarum TaxID=105358 RepID=UPI003A8BB5A8